MLVGAPLACMDLDGYHLDGGVVARGGESRGRAPAEQRVAPRGGSSGTGTCADEVFTLRNNAADYEAYSSSCDATLTLFSWAYVTDGQTERVALGRPIHDRRSLPFGSQVTVQTQCCWFDYSTASDFSTTCDFYGESADVHVQSGGDPYSSRPIPAPGRTSSSAPERHAFGPTRRRSGPPGLAGAPARPPARRTGRAPPVPPYARWRARPSRARRSPAAPAARRTQATAAKASMSASARWDCSTCRSNRRKPCRLRTAATVSSTSPSIRSARAANPATGGGTMAPSRDSPRAATRPSRVWPTRDVA